ncbi:MAG TPA: hypothetical protein PKJ43_08940, partial [Prolixibacteraceae bacterium]|nr:hypothetical protein [Prolixibacteraceae bacterium]
RNDYDYSSITGFATSMEPRNPTLKGRVISDVNTQKGLNKAQVKIIMTFNSRAPYNYTIQTDTTGKFDFTPIFNSICSKNWINDLTYVTIEVSKNGFHYLENGDKKSKYTNGFTPEKFEMGKQVVLDNIHLYADGSIKGRIINENGAPVEAYVQFLENSSSASAVETGEMHKTSGFYTMGNIALGQTGEYISNGKFQIPAIPGSNRKLVIIPKDVTYFSDTLTINVSGSAVTDLGDIKVYERQHRIYFYVKRTMGGDMYQISQPLPGAKVSVIGAANTQTFTSDANGKVVMNFKNVSESNLTLKVSGPPGSNYVPKNIAFTNEESETPVQLPTVYLEQGLTVKGKVLLDGNATADAEVYVELSRGIQTDVDINFASDGGQAVSESQYLFTAKPKSDGTFEINTIPPELKNKQVTLKVVYKKSLSSFGRGQTGSTGTQNQLGNNQTITQSHGSTDEKTIFGESKQVMIPETSGNLVLN